MFTRLFLKKNFCFHHLKSSYTEQKLSCDVQKMVDVHLVKIHRWCTSRQNRAVLLVSGVVLTVYVLNSILNLEAKTWEEQKFQSAEFEKRFAEDQTLQKIHKIEQVQDSKIQLQKHFPLFQANTVAEEAEERNQSAETKFVSLPNQVHVFSAYFDLRNGNMGFRKMRILAVSSAKPVLYCLFPLGSAGKQLLNSEKTVVSYYELAENHAMPYKTYILNCDVPLGLKNLPNFQLQDSESGAKIDIQVLKTLRDPMLGVPKYKYSLCIPVLFGRRYTPENLVEFFETEKLLGIHHAFIYTNPNKISKEMLNVLEFYSNQGFLTIFSIELPISAERLWYHGQLVAIEHCLYHNMGLSKFAFFHDLDERVVPYSGRNYDEMFGKMWEENKKLVGFAFPTLYFQEDSRMPLVAVRNTRQYPQIDKRLTKCIVRPERMFEQGIHHVSRHIQDWYVVQRFNHTVGALHHYKPLQLQLATKENSRLGVIIGEKLQINYNKVIKDIKL